MSSSAKVIKFMLGHGNLQNSGQPQLALNGHAMPRQALTSTYSPTTTTLNLGNQAQINSEGRALSPSNQGNYAEQTAVNSNSGGERNETLDTGSSLNISEETTQNYYAHSADLQEKSKLQEKTDRDLNGCHENTTINQNEDSSVNKEERENGLETLLTISWWPFIVTAILSIMTVGIVFLGLAFYKLYQAFRPQDYFNVNVDNINDDDVKNAPKDGVISGLISHYQTIIINNRKLNEQKAQRQKEGLTLTMISFVLLSVTLIILLFIMA